MGKQRKLRSSIKALQEAITSFRPVVGAPLCIEPSKTHSFRELLSSFNSIYYTRPSTSSSSSSSASSFPSDLCSHHHQQQQQPPTDICTLHPGGEEVETVSSSTITSTAAAASDEPSEAEALPRRGSISSKRFFFSPCTTKSIMGEAELGVGLKKMESAAGEEEQEEEVIDMVVVETTKQTMDSSALCRESIQMAMVSNDPYIDFRNSMEEMVEAHGLRAEWVDLQELLHCYLRLNEKRTHKFIVLAFMDLLMHLNSQDKKKNNSNKHASSHTSPLHLCPPPSD